MSNKIASSSILIQDYAPIVLFAFNRPKHTAITLKALQSAELAKKSELHVFLDGPRNDNDRQQINETLSEINKATGFHKVVIKQRDQNIGLARSICEGIDEILTAYNFAIILEDDIVVSENFLSYMNSALTYYKDEKTVWHIGSYNYSIGSEDEDRTFLWRAMSCWGWATWRDRWAHFKKEPRSLINSFSKQEIHRFNLEGSDDYWSQVLANDSGHINTWAVFWYAIIFKNEGLCLNPVVSLVKNIGFDNSGVHCGNDYGKHTIKHLNSSKVFYFPADQIEDVEIYQQIKRHNLRFKSTLIRRIVNKLVKLTKLESAK